MVRLVIVYVKMYVSNCVTVALEGEVKIYKEIKKIVKL